jgi:hypothetical protein
MTTSRHDAAAKVPQRSTYKHVFVDNMPDMLDEGILYVCVKYATSAHNCFCGCGREVVTPIHPTKWKLTFDGVNVSLFPSVGSWSLPCKSHYWLENGRINWAESWSDEEIRAARSRDLSAQDSYFARVEKLSPATRVDTQSSPSFWRKAANWLRGK